MKSPLTAAGDWVVILVLMGGWADRARAGPLDPGAFTPMGDFPTAAGTYTFNNILNNRTTGEATRITRIYQTAGWRYGTL